MNKLVRFHFHPFGLISVNTHLRSDKYEEGRSARVEVARKRSSTTWAYRSRCALDGCRGARPLWPQIRPDRVDGDVASLHELDQQVGQIDVMEQYDGLLAIVDFALKLAPPFEPSIDPSEVFTAVVAAYEHLQITRALDDRKSTSWVIPVCMGYYLHRSPPTCLSALACRDLVGVVHDGRAFDHIFDDAGGLPLVFQVAELHLDDVPADSSRLAGVALPQLLDQGQERLPGQVRSADLVRPAVGYISDCGTPNSCYAELEPHLDPPRIVCSQYLQYWARCATRDIPDYEVYIYIFFTVCLFLYPLCVPESIQARLVGFEPRLTDVRNSQKQKDLQIANFSYLLNVLAGMEGFEPPNARTKTWCLTTWPHPINRQI